MIEFMSVYDFPPIRKSSKINYRIFFLSKFGLAEFSAVENAGSFCMCVCVCVANSVS